MDRHIKKKNRVWIVTEFTLDKFIKCTRPTCKIKRKEDI